MSFEPRRSHGTDHSSIGEEELERFARRFIDLGGVEASLNIFYIFILHCFSLFSHIKTKTKNDL